MKSEDIQDLVKEIALNCYSVRLRLLNRVVGAIFDEALRPHEIRASQLNILVAVAGLRPGDQSTTLPGPAHGYVDLQ